MTKTLIAGASTQGVFAASSFPQDDGIRSFQFVPGGQFTGTVVIEGSMESNPSNSSFSTILTVVFNGHSSTLMLNARTNLPTIRAKITSASSGSITVYGSSQHGNRVDGGKGSSPYTALVTSSLPVGGVGNGFKIDSALVPSLTTDDVFDANYPTRTLTEALALKADAASGTPVTATGDDLNLLQGMASYGLTSTDFQKLADVSVSASEINMLSGVTSNVQSQLNNLSSQIPSSLSGTTVSGSFLNIFFDTAPTVTVSDINALSGLGGSVSAADLSVFAGSAGSFTMSDLTKLHAVTATAAELNALDGYTGSTADLNKIAGLSASRSDLNAVSGYASTGVTSTEIGYLSGLTQNVQAALNQIPTGLSSLTASANDIDLLTGAAAGTGAYSAGSISATEISYLNGLTSNIQQQLDGKRNTTDPIGIAEISGATITTTELNSLSGVSSNIQTQIDNISTTYLPLAGGTMTGVIQLSSGSVGTPALSFSADNTTGLFLNGGTDVAFAIGGTQYFNLSTAGLSIGTAATSPYAQVAGTTTSPQYTFNGHTGSGVAMGSPDVVSVVANAIEMVKTDGVNNEVRIAPDTAQNTTVTVDGPFEGIKVLGKAANVELGTGGAVGGSTAIYQPAAGRNAIITKVLFHVKTVTGYVANTIQVDLGIAADEFLSGAASTAFFANATTSGNVVAVNDSDMSVNGSSYQVITSADTLNLKLVAANNSGTYTVDVIVFGYEF